MINLTHTQKRTRKKSLRLFQEPFIWEKSISFWSLFYVMHPINSFCWSNWISISIKLLWFFVKRQRRKLLLIVLKIATGYGCTKKMSIPCFVCVQWIRQFRKSVSYSNHGIVNINNFQKKKCEPASKSIFKILGDLSMTDSHK